MDGQDRRRYALRSLRKYDRNYSRGCSCADGNRIGDIGNAIESCILEYGYSVVKRYIGHGVGHELHEAPDVPNYGTPGRGVRLCNGMTLAIEPMVNIGKSDVRELDDGWTVKTADGTLSAHYENSIAITPEGVLVLTEVERGL